MRNAMRVLMVALLLSVGLAAQGEAATKRVTACIKRVFLHLGEAPGHALVAVVVGDDVFYFTHQGMQHGRTQTLNWGDVAALEPLLALIRAGAQARVQAFVDWDDSTRRVVYFEILFDRPCQ